MECFSKSEPYSAIGVVSFANKWFIWTGSFGSFLLNQNHTVQTCNAFIKHLVFFQGSFVATPLRDCQHRGKMSYSLWVAIFPSASVTVPSVCQLFKETQNFTFRSLKISGCPLFLGFVSWWLWRGQCKGVLEAVRAKESHLIYNSFQNCTTACRFIIIIKLIKSLCSASVSNTF